jgi:hypothetical protein
MKIGKQTYFFLASYVLRRKCLNHSQKDPGSGKNSSRIRILDPEGKKAPAPESATLHSSQKSV